MQKIMLFLFVTTYAFSITIEEAMMLKYGSYISASLLFVFLLIIFLIYWIFQYKKDIKKLRNKIIKINEELNVMELKLQEGTLEKVQDMHKFEKKVSELNQNIKSLEDDLKKGLKSQVIAKIDEYQSKRTKQLDRVDIKV